MKLVVFKNPNVSIKNLLDSIFIPLHSLNGR